MRRTAVMAVMDNVPAADDATRDEKTHGVSPNQFKFVHRFIPKHRDIECMVQHIYRKRKPDDEYKKVQNSHSKNVPQFLTSMNTNSKLRQRAAG
jgi:nickel-dependent lactate racemase